MIAHKSSSASNAGFSLIELLVAMLIGTVVTIAITSVMVSFSERKRTSTSLNDANQTGTYSGFLLDRTIRNAGSGFAQRSDEVFGCLINATTNGQAVLPRPDNYPAPFDNIPSTRRARRLMPVLIDQGAADSGKDVRGDVLTVMSGTSGFGEWPQSVLPGTVTASGLQLPNTLGWRGGDLVLLADKTVSGCIFEQVSAGFVGSASPLLTFNATTALNVFYATAGSTVNLTSFGAGNDTYAIQLGNALDNPPELQMFAVGENATLESLDLLKPGTDGLAPVADGVVEMRAIYGVDTNGDRKRDSWADPGVSGFDAATLSSGSAAARTNLKNIVAIRIGLILRSSLRERDPVKGPASVTLFKDLPGERTRTFTDEELHYRYRAIEMTIPLRNVLYEP